MGHMGSPCVPCGVTLCAIWGHSLGHVRSPYGPYGVTLPMPHVFVLEGLGGGGKGSAARADRKPPACASVCFSTRAWHGSLKRTHLQWAICVVAFAWAWAAAWAGVHTQFDPHRSHGKQALSTGEPPLESLQPALLI